MTTNINNLTPAQKSWIRDLAEKGQTYPEIVVTLDGSVDYRTVKKFCVSVGAYSFPHAKHIITNRLNRISRQTTIADRRLLVQEVKLMVDYLGQRLKAFERKLEQVHDVSGPPSVEEKPS